MKLYPDIVKANAKEGDMPTVPAELQGQVDEIVALLATSITGTLLHIFFFASPACA